jgi:hypothetical protein
VKIKSGKGESVRISVDDPGMVITLEYTSKDTILDVTWCYQPKVLRKPAAQLVCKTGSEYGFAVATQDSFMPWVQRWIVFLPVRAPLYFALHFFGRRWFAWS